MFPYLCWISRNKAGVTPTLFTLSSVKVCPLGPSGTPLALDHGYLSGFATIAGHNGLR